MEGDGSNRKRKQIMEDDGTNKKKRRSWNEEEMHDSLKHLERVCPVCKSGKPQIRFWMFANGKNTQPRYKCDVCPRQFTLGGRFYSKGPARPPSISEVHVDDNSPEMYSEIFSDSSSSNDDSSRSNDDSRSSDDESSDSSSSSE